MPIYEYECSECGHVTEAWQKFSDPPLSQCELCRGRVRKLISQSTFHLKGSGWYVTDYANRSEASRQEKQPEKKTKETQGKASGSSSSTRNDSAGASS